MSESVRNLLGVVRAALLWKVGVERGPGVHGEPDDARDARPGADGDLAPGPDDSADDATTDDATTDDATTDDATTDDATTTHLPSGWAAGLRGSTVLPAVPTRSRRARVGRAASWLALALGVVLLIGSGTGYGLYRHYGDKITTLPGIGDLAAPRSGSPELAPEDEVYLVVGSDSADGLTDRQLREIGANRSQREGTRTDTILLVQVPASGDRARVISFPRDSLVDIPGHGRDKINAAYELGEERRRGTGPALLIETVEDLSGLSIDHYVEVSLFSFVTITEALGGVEVCLARPARDEDARIDLPAGRQELDGRQALAFVRQRQGVPGGDIGRIRRQQYFLGALTRKVLSAGTLLNPARLNSLLNAVVDSVKVDPGTDQTDLLQLALQMRGLQAGAVEFETLPVVNAYARYQGQSVVLLDEAALPAFFRSDFDEPGRSRVRLTVPPRSIAVTVEAPTSDRAADVAQALRSVDFRIAATRGGGDGGATTEVRHGRDRLESAQTVAAALPGAVLRADDTVGRRGLVVSVGDDYSGVERVRVSQPRPSSAPREARTAADDDCIP